MSRSPEKLLRGLSAGDIPADSISPAEVTALRRHCRRVVEKKQFKILDAHLHGNAHIARREQSRLLNSLAARLLASWYGVERRVHGNPWIFVPVWRIANRLRQPKPGGRAICIPKRKADGTFRDTYKFDEFGIAQQKLAVIAVQPFVSFHPSQFTLCRGRSAACEALLGAMKCVLTSNTRFIQFDVRDFFGSASQRWIEENLPLPRIIIQNVILIKNWRIIHGRQARVRVHEVTEGMDQLGLGLPQGSAASSLVAEYIMADVLRSVADQLEGLTLFTYSDNLGILMPEKRVAALQRTLRDAFKMHPAGPFHLTTTGPSPLTRPFRFLGYHWIKPNNEPARAFVPEHQIELRLASLIGKLLNAATAYEVRKIGNQMKSYCAAFNLWRDAAQHDANFQRLVADDLTYRARLQLVHDN